MGTYSVWCSYLVWKDKSRKNVKLFETTNNARANTLCEELRTKLNLSFTDDTGTEEITGALGTVPTAFGAESSFSRPLFRNPAQAALPPLPPASRIQRLSDLDRLHLVLPADKRKIVPPLLILLLIGGQFPVVNFVQAARDPAFFAPMLVFFGLFALCSLAIVLSVAASAFSDTHVTLSREEVAQYRQLGRKIWGRGTLPTNSIDRVFVEGNSVVIATPTARLKLGSDLKAPDRDWLAEAVKTTLQ